MIREERVNKTKNRNGMISVKDIMKKYHISYQTVNHYTDFGLLPILSKMGNTRFYDKKIVGARLRQIRKLMNEGYSLRLIRKQLLGI